MIRASALLISVGALLSGPVAMALLLWLAPQPNWTDVDTFVLHYRPFQTAPYWLGFVLLGGFVLFTAACHGRAEERHRIRTTVALTFTAIYAAMVFTNYMLQVGVVPRLLTTEPDLVAILTMANPSSVAWFLEMFGYAALGIAMWLVSPLFGGTRLLVLIRWLLVVNAVLSLVGAILTSFVDRWVFSVTGLASFFAWNIVVIICFGLMATQREGATVVVE
jgi:hypothetical protein